ncbi:MAG: hypothetical protein LZT29_04270 (plasmid) [Pantoea stewartii]|nr:MAG: hypothetical protein LZT29_04270 [Pantoea stewartii]
MNNHSKKVTGLVVTLITVNVMTGQADKIHLLIAVNLSSVRREIPADYSERSGVRSRSLPVAAMFTDYSECYRRVMDGPECQAEADSDQGVY